MWGYILDNDTKRVAVFDNGEPEAALKEATNAQEYDVEQDWQGNWYIKGYAPEPDLAAMVRAERAERLRRDCDSIPPLRIMAMDEDEREAWAAYRQALLDIPQTEGFPWDGNAVPWPEKPNS